MAITLINIEKNTADRITFAIGVSRITQSNPPAGHG